MFRSIARRLLKLLFWLAVGSALLVLALRWIPPPGTALMLERKIDAWRDDQPIDLQRTWRPWAELPDDLKMAVIAAEDQKFLQHNGFDLIAIEKALAFNAKSKRVRGASTISQQTAKNVFLWTGRSWLRKGLESGLTVLIEGAWGKERILEVYLNSIEFGEGVFGVEAAAQRYFKTSAVKLTKSQAALLAAVLPNPHRLLVKAPSSYVRGRQQWILRQMAQLPSIAAELQQR